MLDASPHLSFASPAVRHVVTASPRQPSSDPQHDTFQTSNSTRYLKTFRLFAQREQTKKGENRSIHLWQVSSGDKIDYQLRESQVWRPTPCELMRTTRSTGPALSFTDFGRAASVETNALWLKEALIELAACPIDALDEGLEDPSQLGLEKAEQLLREISCHIDERPDIYPMDEGSIAIDFRNPERKSGILFLVERDGSGAFFDRTNNSKGRLRVYDAADLLPEGGLMELKRVGIT